MWDKFAADAGRGIVKNKSNTVKTETTFFISDLLGIEKRFRFCGTAEL
jgi:hypothetical protein